VYRRHCSWKISASAKARISCGMAGILPINKRSPSGCTHRISRFIVRDGILDITQVTATAPKASSNWAPSITAKVLPRLRKLSGVPSRVKR